MGGGLLLPTSPFSLLKTTAWSLAPSQLIFRSSEGRLREQQQRDLEQCPSPGACDLLQCFKDGVGVPFTYLINELACSALAVKGSICERIADELGTRAQEMEPSNARRQGAVLEISSV